MRICGRRRVDLAVTLVCGCAVVNLLVFQYACWRKYAGKSEREEEIAARYAPLRDLLPDGEAARFVMDEKNPTDPDFYRRMFFVQYVVSPKLVGKDVKSRWIIVDSAPAIACQVVNVVKKQPGANSSRNAVLTRPGIINLNANKRCKLVADLHNGVTLYRTDVGE